MLLSTAILLTAMASGRIGDDEQVFVPTQHRQEEMNDGRVVGEFVRDGNRHAFEVPLWAQPVKSTYTLRTDKSFELAVEFRAKMPASTNGCLAIEAFFEAPGKQLLSVISGLELGTNPALFRRSAAIVDERRWDVLARAQLRFEDKTLIVSGIDGEAMAFIYVAYIPTNAGKPGDIIPLSNFWESPLFPKGAVLSGGVEPPRVVHKLRQDR